MSSGFAVRACAVLFALFAYWSGAAGAEEEEAPLDVDVQVLESPKAIYPLMAALFRVPGYCDVRFAVNAFGLPVDIQPSCSHAAFCQSAREAVGRARFSPARRNGVAVRRGNIVYPMEYNVPGVPMPASLELTACSTQAIS
jgi:TonB family protein